MADTPAAHFLIVDRDAARRAAVAAALRAAGHTVEEAADAASGAAALADPRVTGLLLDTADPTLDRSALMTVLAPDAGPPDTLDDAERRHIARMLAHTQGNRRQAALLLGISRSTLLQKLRKYGLDDRHRGA